MDPPAYGSRYPAKPPSAVVVAGDGSTVGWGVAVVKIGSSSQAGRGDGEGGKRICVIGTPCGGGGGAGKEVAGGGGGGAKAVAGGGVGGATGPCRYVRRLDTAVARSRTAVESSAGESMG